MPNANGEEPDTVRFAASNYETDGCGALAAGSWLNEPVSRDPGALRGNPIKTAASDHSAPVHSSAHTGNSGGEVERPVGLGLHLRR